MTHTELICRYTNKPTLKIHLQSKKFEDIGDINRDMTAQFDTKSDVPRQNGKLPEIGVLSGKRTVMKEINISFIVRFCFD